MIPAPMLSQYLADPRAKYNSSLVEQGSSTAPVRTHTEGLARALSGIIGAYSQKQLKGEYEREQTAQDEATKNAIMQMMGPAPITEAPINGAALQDFNGPITPNPADRQRDMIMALISNRHTLPTAEKLAMAMATQDPAKRNLQFQNGQIVDLDAGVASPVQGYRQDTAQILSPEDVARFGYPAGSVVQVGADGVHKVTHTPPDILDPRVVGAKKDIAAAGATNLTNVVGSKLPPGYMWADPDNPRGGIKPIPGGPVEREDAATKKAGERAISANRSKYTVISSNIDKSLNDIGFLSTGFIGKMLSAVPGTGAYNVGQVIDTLKANIGFDALQAMREASPTGGALGQVSERELAQLERVLGSLDQGQSEDQLLANLLAVRTHYGNWKNAVEEFYGSSLESPDSGVLPSGLTESDIEYNMEKYNKTRQQVIEAYKAR